MFLRPKKQGGTHKYISSKNVTQSHVMQPLVLFGVNYGDTIIGFFQLFPSTWHHRSLPEKSTLTQ